MTTELSDQEVMDEVVNRLSEKNSDVARDVIDKVVREEYAALSGGTVRDYLSVLTERAAKKRLKKLAKTAQ